jgi:enterochelin esterase-like enzyme
MHDGQMLFDDGITWNRQEWGVDETASRLQARGETRPFIVVGVWNGGPMRHAEYFPQKAFDELPAETRAQLLAGRRPDGVPLFEKPVASNAYLRWLTGTVLPEIQRRYAVSDAAADRVVIGSSMGGLISMYALGEYPDTFGAAGCLSTHWPGIFSVEGNPIPAAFFAYLQRSLPAPVRHRLWFDHGTETLDALYPPLQRQADAVIRGRGYGDGDFVSRSYPGTDHSERAWAARLDEVLRFLLPPR